MIDTHMGMMPPRVQRKFPSSMSLLAQVGPELAYLAKHRFDEGFEPRQPFASGHILRRRRLASD